MGKRPRTGEEEAERAGLLLYAASKPSHAVSDADYIVCNPATRKWTVLPDTGEQHSLIDPHLCLGFDPSVTSRFHVFMFVVNYASSQSGVKIYSSETGAWRIIRQNEWGGDSIRLNGDAEPVFFNDTLYAVTPDLSLITVDTQGKITWGKVPTPHRAAFITHSQGRLYATHVDYHHDNLLSLWQFDADGDENWTLKHTARVARLLGRCRDGYREFCSVIAAHPECNLNFLAGGMGDELMSYDLDSKEFRVICSLENCFHGPMLPYVPCFADWPLDGLKKCVSSHPPLC